MDVSLVCSEIVVIAVPSVWLTPSLFQYIFKPAIRRQAVSMTCKMLTV